MTDQERKKILSDHIKSLSPLEREAQIRIAKDICEKIDSREFWWQFKNKYIV